MASTSKPLTFQRFLRRMQYQKLIFICLLIFFVYKLINSFLSNAPPFKSPLITVKELHEKMQDNEVKIVDATYSPKAEMPDMQQYQTNYYGNFEFLFKQFAEDAYTKEHIPGAVSLSMDVGFHMNKFKRFDLYPSAVAEKLLRLLGINNDDTVIVYGRGPVAGMLFAAHIWWLLKYYGVEKAYVLNGGFDAWKKAGNPVAAGTNTTELGNFNVKVNRKFSISFEELEAENANGKAPIDYFETINVFDARPFEQYAGTVKMYNPSLRGSHINGAKSLPVAQLFNENGLLPVQIIRQALDKAGFNPGKPVILYCNSGSQASLLFLALYHYGIDDIKLYQGGMNEMAVRDPERIS